MAAGTRSRIVEVLHAYLQAGMSLMAVFQRCMTGCGYSYKVMYTPKARKQFLPSAMKPDVASSL